MGVGKFIFSQSVTLPTIPFDVLSLDVSVQARFLFILIMSRYEFDGAFFDKGELIKLMKCSDDSLRKYTKELVDKKFLSREQIKTDAGRFGQMKYIILTTYGT